jgi:hypothetical protein
MKTEDCNQKYTKNIQSNAHSGKYNNGTRLTCHMSIVLVQFWCQTVYIGKSGSNYVHVHMCNSETQKCNGIQESQAVQSTAQSLLNGYNVHVSHHTNINMQWTKSDIQ